jgi:hypothetical protein
MTAKSKKTRFVFLCLIFVTVQTAMTPLASQQRRYPMTNNVSSKTVQITPAMPIVKRCNELIKRREDWEVGAYKASNDQLYDILADAYALYLFLVNSATADDRKTFKNVLKAKKVPHQDNTPLHTRVVRLVFAASRQRSFTYGRVLFAARKEGIKAADLPSWIRDNKGIEEVKVKSSGKLTPAQQAKADAEHASHILASSEALLAIGKVIADLKPNAELNPIYSIALVRCDGGADAEIVWGTSNSGALAKVLAIAGKQLRTDAAAKAVKNARRNAAKSARSAIASTASKLRAKSAAPVAQKIAA